MRGKSAPPQSAVGTPGPETPGRPPAAVGGRRQGTKGGTAGNPPSPPHLTPPLPPPPARGQPEGPLHPGAGRHDRGERSRAPSAPGRPPAHSRVTCGRPAALHRRRTPQRNGGTQEYADEAAHLGSRLEKAAEQTVARRPPPPPRHTDPPAADRAAPGAHHRPATTAECVYPGVVRRRRRGTRTGATGHPPGQGSGEQRRGPPSPLPHIPPPGLRATGAPALHPPRGRGGVPPAPEGTVMPGGGGAAGPARRAPPRPPLPASVGVATGGRTRTSAQERRAGNARGRHATANRSSMGAAPPMT